MSEEVSDTPLTDAMFTAWNWRDVSKCDAENPADFTRRLERSIVELNQRLIDRTAAFMADKAKDVARINALEALTARQSQAVGVEWQPIETAPKDRDILLCVAGCEPCLGQWYNNQWIDHRVDAFESISDVERYLQGTEYAPTHWMPLPPRAIPNDSGKEGGE